MKDWQVATKHYSRACDAMVLLSKQSQQTYEDDFDGQYYSYVHGMRLELPMIKLAGCLPAGQKISLLFDY